MCDRVATRRYISKILEGGNLMFDVVIVGAGMAGAVFAERVGGVAP